MSSKSKNVFRPMTTKSQRSGKKSGAKNSLYSGLPSAQRALQQQYYFGSTSPWRSSQGKRVRQLINANVTESPVPPPNYHPWQAEYHQIFTREKKLKPMTKDPYTPKPRLISHAVENVITESECCTTLIPAKAVKIQTLNIRYAPRPIVPTIVRYLRRNEPMPSERPATSITATKVSLFPQTQDTKSTISVSNSSKITGVAPALVTQDRLLNRVKMRNDVPAIRRPPRKLILNISHETIMPLSVYA